MCYLAIVKAILLSLADNRWFIWYFVIGKAILLIPGENWWSTVCFVIGKVILLRFTDNWWFMLFFCNRKSHSIESGWQLMIDVMFCCRQTPPHLFSWEQTTVIGHALWRVLLRVNEAIELPIYSHILGSLDENQTALKFWKKMK